MAPKVSEEAYNANTAFALRSKRLRQVPILMGSLGSVHHMGVQFATRLIDRQAHHSFIMNLL